MLLNHYVILNTLLDNNSIWFIGNSISFIVISICFIDNSICFNAIKY